MKHQLTRPQFRRVVRAARISAEEVATPARNPHSWLWGQCGKRHSTESLYHAKRDFDIGFDSAALGTHGTTEDLGPHFGAGWKAGTAKRKGQSTAEGMAPGVR